jgi:hypothetical protein
MSSGSFRLAKMHWIIEPISVLPLFFSYFLAILETWLGIMEALPRLLVPNPTQQQRAAAPGGLVYDHISLKVERTELANKREAILKNWIPNGKVLVLSI